MPFKIYINFLAHRSILLMLLFIQFSIIELQNDMQEIDFLLNIEKLIRNSNDLEEKIQRILYEQKYLTYNNFTTCVEWQ